jgi:carbamoyl-phosphate synthase large subunit
VTNQEELKKAGEDFEYPLVIKGKFYDAYVANNLDQAENYFNKLSAKWGLPVIVQEFVMGTEVNVVALGDGNGNTIGSVPMRKLYITDKGKAWSGITLDDQKMLELTRNLISATRWRGGMELELIRSDDDEYYLIEINPRIPAWVYLAVGAGQNIPEALVKLATGMEVEPFRDYKKGVIFVRYSFDLITDIKEFEKLSISGVL